MAVLRGRAAQTLRPGLVIKAVLSGDIPLTTGEVVHEASITDLHSVYKYLVAQENLTRPRERRLHGMTYRSFATLFRFAYLMGLVEKVREEPMLFPPPGGKLFSIRLEEGKPRVVESKRVIYRLTDVGKEDELAWLNLCKAWIEKWPVPQKAPVFPKVEVKPIPVPEVKPTPIPEVKPIPEPPRLTERPSITQFRKFYNYLVDLKASGLSEKELLTKLDEAFGRVRDWDINIEDALVAAEKARKKERVEQLKFWNSCIKEAVESFLDDDFDGVLEAFRRLVE